MRIICDIASLAGLSTVEQPAVVVLDCEIPGLEQHSLNREVTEIGNIKCRRRNAPEPRRVDRQHIVALEHVHQKRRLARRRPVQLELGMPVGHRQIDGHRIVHVLARKPPEAVSVVETLDLRAVRQKPASSMQTLHQNFTLFVNLA